ncbi:MAG TPA: helix-hairpin-helix domain-containing protein [Ornithinimicrobium sp.]|nr:helix-hairpin-helix domain-containing protein [Ornithinimicrobium sp.]
MSSTISRSGTADPLGELLRDGRERAEPPDTVESGRHRPGRVPFLSVPSGLRSLELGVGPAAVRGVLVLVVVAALVLAGRWAWVGQRSQPSPEDRVQSLDAVMTTTAAEVMGETAGSPEEPGASSAGSQGAEGDPDRPADVVVHVTGQVGRPGVVTLPQGARVVDAVEAAGGLSEGADQSSLNLARQLTDGEQLWVGRPGEEPPPGLLRGAGGGGSGGGSGGAGVGPGSAGGGEATLVVDLNRATQAELEELPGVGPVTAGRILAWREEHGGFSVPEELLEVSGIGERTFEQLQPHVSVGG